MLRLRPTLEADRSQTEFGIGCLNGAILSDANSQTQPQVRLTPPFLWLTESRLDELSRSAAYEYAPQVYSQPKFSCGRSARDWLSRSYHSGSNMTHAEYPDYTSGGDDDRWYIQNAFEGGDLVWVVFSLYVASFCLISIHRVAALLLGF